MSHPSHHQEISADLISPQKTRPLALIALVVGLLGLAGSAAYLFLAGEGAGKQLAFSSLFAGMYFLTLTVGSLFWVFVHHATDAQWSVVVRRQLENVGVLIPVVGLFFAFILYFGTPLLYKWWTLAPGADELLDHKAPYLNHTGFAIRAVIYFVALGILSFLIRRNSIRQDADGHPVHTLRNRFLSFMGIPALALSLTFAAVDWLMALDHTWFSTMWGVYMFAGGAGSAMGLLVLVITALRKAGHLKEVTIEHYHVMGKFMLAFCVFWAYIGYSQYMLIWYANIPEETSFYIRRNTETWWYMSMALVIGRFFLPFPVLLFQATKKNPKYLCMVAGWILLMHALDIYILVLPMLHQQGVSPALTDFTMPLAFAGILVAAFLWILPKQSLFPPRDPRIEKSLHLSN